MINIVGELKNANFDFIKGRDGTHRHHHRRYGVISKVIFENYYLTKDEIKVVCRDRQSQA